MSRRGMSRWIGAAVLGGALLLGGRTARADDPPHLDPAARALVLEWLVAIHTLFDSVEGLAADAEAVRVLAGEVEDPAVRRRLVSLAGRILDVVRDDGAERTAVRALGVLGDPAGFTFLRRFFGVDRLAAVHAVGRMRADESVPVLLELAERDPDGEIAGAAVSALAEFGRNVGTREEILRRLVRGPTVPEVVERPPEDLDDGTHEPRDFDDLAKMERFRRIARARRERELRFRAVLPALGRLTGREDTSAGVWHALLSEHEKDLSVLFRDLPPAAPEPVERASPELLAKAAAWETTARAHLAAQDGAAMSADLAAMGELVAATRDPDLRSRLVDAVGAIHDGAREPRVRREAIPVLGALGSANGFRFLRPHLLPRYGGAQRPILFDAIEAAVGMRAVEALPLLFDAVDRERAPVAALALRAVAVLARDPAARGQVFVDLTDRVRRRRHDEPDEIRPPPCLPWEGEYSRYQVLSRVLLETFNRETGRELGGPQSLYELVDSMRADPTKLFLR